MTPVGEAEARETRGYDGDNGTTSTRSGSPSAAAGAAQMLQLAVGRSPVRVRRTASPAETHARLTDASLAAFDLQPAGLDDPATTTAVQAGAGHLLDSAEFAAAATPFNLQT